MTALNLKYLRAKKKRHLEEFYKNYENRTDKLYIKKFNNIILDPVGRIEDIVETDHVIVDDCFFTVKIDSTDSIANSKNFDLYCSIDAYYCGFYRHEYGHFITSSLSRLWYAVKNNLIETGSIKRFVYFYNPGSHLKLPQNIVSILKYIGIWDRIEFLNTPAYFQEIVIPDPSFKLLTYYSKEANLVYDKIIKNVLNQNKIYNKVNFNKNIFLSRTKLPTAKLCEIGGDYIENIFKTNGFEIIYPEQINLEELILKLQNAELIGGFAGSTVHNFLFTKKRLKCFVVERNAILNDFQPAIDLIKDLNVTYVDAFLTINNVNYGLGPFLYFPTKYLKNFILDYNLTNKQKYPLKKYLKRYLKTWKRFYNYQWYFQNCSLPQIDSLTEAYNESFEIVGGYLQGHNPLFIKDFISIPYLKKKLSSSNFIYSFLHKIYKISK